MRSLPFILPALLALSAAAARAEVPEVLTDTPVTQALAAAVTGDLTTPVVLLAAGADAHDFQLRPSQIGAFASAGLVVWAGPAMTPWLGNVMAASDAPPSLVLLDVPGMKLRPYGEEDEHGHEGGHDHGSTDPHAWLNPENAILWTGAIAERLAARDPGNAATYRANARSAEAAIKAMDEELKTRLAPAAGKGIITGHDAYGYFAEHYGLALRGALAEGDAAPPGAGHLAEVTDLLNSGEIACIFPEAGRSAPDVAALASGTAVRVGAPLDPEGRGLPPGPDLYRALMTGLADAIADCVAAE